MECTFCKRIYESEEEEQAKNLENKKKVLMEEIQKFEQANREKEANSSRKGLNKINRKIEQLESKEICPKCEAIIGKIIEAKIEEKIGDISYNVIEEIKDSISIEFNN